MDIDDILAEVSRDSPAQQHEQAARDLQELTRLWVAERVAPELLPYPDALMERVLDRVRRQVRAQAIIFFICFFFLARCRSEVARCPGEWCFEAKGGCEWGLPGLSADRVVVRREGGRGCGEGVTDENVGSVSGGEGAGGVFSSFFAIGRSWEANLMWE